MYVTDEEDVHTGIEKGYEHFLLPSSDDVSEAESVLPETPVIVDSLLSNPFLHCERNNANENVSNDSDAAKNTESEDVCSSSDTAKLRQFRKTLKRPLEQSEEVQISKTYLTCSLLNCNLLFRPLASC